MVSASPLRTQVRRQTAAAKKASKGFAKGKTFKAPALRKLKIRV